MNDNVRKKSPRAPSMPLDEAIEKAIRVYEREKRHAAPVDAVAQALGYKNANNGAALSALASLRYYGLVDRHEEGRLSITKDVETYQYAPDPSIKKQVLQKLLRAPAVFNELLDKFPSELPSDATLRFELINRGFSPASAESVISVFRKSVNFVGPLEDEPAPGNSWGSSEIEEEQQISKPIAAVPATSSNFEPVPSSAPNIALGQGADQIPVRLSGGRRAWLVIPSPFYSADKKRLKAQIDLLICEGDEDEVAE